MSWVILDKCNQREATLIPFTQLTFGHEEVCDVALPKCGDSGTEAEVYFDDALAYVCRSDQTEVFERDFDLRFQEADFHVQRRVQSRFWEGLEIDDASHLRLVDSDVFRCALAEVQMGQGDRPLMPSGGAESPDADVLKAAVVALNGSFWRSRSPCRKEDRQEFRDTVWAIWAHSCRHGLLTRALSDESVTEIMVNGVHGVYFETDGRTVKSPLLFQNASTLMMIIERIVSRCGKRIDESSPFCDARLPDGSRAHAIIPPLALDGPLLTIRKFSRRLRSPSDLLASGTIDARAHAFLAMVIRQKKNILVSGGTGAGKTTLLNVLSSFIPPDERIVTIEDSAELQLVQPHVVRLEARGNNVEGRGAVTVRELVRNALRMRPDRIVVGECRGGEALDVLQAMGTGHDGSLATLHANSPEDALRRFELLTLFSGVELPLFAVREMVASHIGLVIQIARLGNGARRVTEILRVEGLDSQTGGYALNRVMTYDPLSERWLWN